MSAISALCAKSNEQISKLNTELSSLTVQRDKLGTGTKANQAKLSQLNTQIASVGVQMML